MVKSEDVKKVEFDRLYDKYAGRVYRTADYYVKDHYAAEEVSQEVFMKLYKNLGDIHMEAVSWWLLATSRNMAMNYQRDRNWEIPVEEIDDRDFEYPLDGLDDCLVEVIRQQNYCELKEKIFQELYVKNPRWYDAVSITYVLGKPQKEVAESMEISLEVLHSTLYRAKQWIRKHYEEEFHQLDDR